MEKRIELSDKFDSTVYPVRLSVRFVECLEISASEYGMGVDDYVKMVLSDHLINKT